MSETGPVAAALDAIRARAELGAFWAVDEEAVATAGNGPLAGVAVGVKDCFDVAGLPTTAGVPGPAPPARRDAELVRRLRHAGATPVGKTAMDQLGWSVNGTAPGRAACRNPRDPTRSPGGSSAGSACAVAAGLVPLAIGSDTAGSVRIPAAYCGVVGFKPAHRALPVAGLAATVPSLETPGLLARDVATCRRAYEAVTGRAVPPPVATLALVIGRLDDLLEEADADVARATVAALGALGPEARVVPTRLGWRPRGLGRLFAAELDHAWGARIRAEPERFTPELRDAAAHGATVPSAERGTVLAELGRARRRLRRRLEAFHVVAAPTAPGGAPPAGTATVARSSRFALPFNALGWPAVSVPCGSDARGLPVGVQLAARPGRLPELLAVAAALDRLGAGA